MIEQIRDLVDEQIAYTTEAIERHKTVGTYFDACNRWRLELEVYVKVRDMIARVMLPVAEVIVPPVVEESVPDQTPIPLITCD